LLTKEPVTVEAEAKAPEDTNDTTPGRLARALVVARRALGWVVAALPFAVVLLALLLPNRLGRLTPVAFVHLPVEAIIGVGFLLVLRTRVRRVLAAVGGALLGALAIMKILDMGFYAILARPFDPVLDWVLFDDALGFLTDELGRAAGIGAAIGVVALIAGLLTLTTFSLMRVDRALARHRTAATRGVLALGLVWVVCAAFAVQVVPGVPVAARTNVSILDSRAHLVSAGLRDREAFAAQAAKDKYGGAPGDQLLTALRGKDVIFAFVESYGRVAIDDPLIAAQVGPVLDTGDRRLTEAGFSSRSAYLTSSTFGGGSWLAHATFFSGLWIDNHQRYRTLVSSNRLTLSEAFRRASWDTVAVVPGIKRAWPEADFYGYDRVYDSRNLGYRGPSFGWSTMPDQFTLAAFQRLEHGRAGNDPIMAEIPLVSSHGPWTPTPWLLDWNAIGDGTVFEQVHQQGVPKSEVWRDRTRVKQAYGRSVAYSVNSLISYVQTYGNDDTVMIFLGDHQPASMVSGENASHDVPITIVTRDQAVLDRISGWEWQEGLKPNAQAPVWRMNAFRDKFLTAFGPQAPAPPSAQAAPARR
jgi:hypothetical protein